MIYCRARPPGVAAAALAAGLRVPAAPAHAQGAAVTLAPHRAVYDLKLSTTARQARDERGARPHPLRFLRQRLRGLCAAIPPGVRARQRRGQGGAQRPARTSTWEDGAAKRCRFNSQNYFDEKSARLGRRPGRRGKSDGVAVELKEPGEKKLDLQNELVFPTEHVRRIIAAARDGKTLLRGRGL